MKKWILIGMVMLLLTPVAEGSEGVINVPSHASVTVTADRLENIIKEKGMVLFDRISHSEGARRVGLNLRDTELIIFGNPKVGTPLMQCQQSLAIDLPQKALIWEDKEGRVWISYNDPWYLKKRHGLVGCDDAIIRVDKALAGIIQAAAQ